MRLQMLVVILLLGMFARGAARPLPTGRAHLPREARFYDLMGNERTPEDGGKVPLTAAPLFVMSQDADVLLSAFDKAKF